MSDNAILQKPILLVDDDETFASILQRALQHQQIVSVLAHSPATAMEKVQQQHFDYAVLDLNLDGQSGLNLLKDLLSVQPSCKVLILTGYASVATAVEAMRLGAMDYLCKPASAQDILKALHLMEADAVAPEEIEEEDFQSMSVKRLEWEHIQKVLVENDGNISATAQALNMHRRTLQRKLQKRPVDK